jgi:hypothetical protein
MCSAVTGKNAKVKKWVEKEGPFYPETAEAKNRPDRFWKVSINTTGS